MKYWNGLGERRPGRSQFLVGEVLRHGLVGHVVEVLLGGCPLRSAFRDQRGVMSDDADLTTAERMAEVEGRPCLGPLRTGGLSESGEFHSGRFELARQQEPFRRGQGRLGFHGQQARERGGHRRRNHPPTGTLPTENRLPNEKHGGTDRQ